MTSFILAAATLMLVALALLLRPWLHRRPTRRTASADFSNQLNTAIHRDRLAELERDRTSGMLSAADYIEAREELQRQLLDDTAAAGDSAEKVEASPSRRSGIILALLLPALAIGLYLLLGNPAALISETERAQQAAAKMESLVAQLAQKMEQHPEDPQGWAMLARSYKALGRWDEAEHAFARVGPTLEQDAGLLADLAEVLAQKANSFEGHPHELIAQALRVDANDARALLLAGVDAFDSTRYDAAIGYWQRLLKTLEPGSENAQMIEAGIARARERLGGKVGAVSGRVELAPALRTKAASDATVFIFARAVGGPRMPLAVQRARVSDLPLNFTLDDSMAMQPGHGISSATELRIEVRVSKSGQAMPGPGDLTGASAPVKPGAKGVRVIVDTLNN